MAGTDEPVIEQTAVETPAPQAAPAVAPVDNPNDDVRAALESLKTKDAAPAAQAETPPKDKPSPDPSAAAPDKPRNPDGTFAKSTDKPEAAPVKAAPDKPIPEKANEPKATDTVSTPSGPPGRFSAAAKQAWSTTPPAIQEAVSRMASEIDNAGRQWSQERQTYRSVFDPIAAEAKALGLDPVQGVQALLNAHRQLQSPDSAVSWMIGTAQQGGFLPNLLRALNLDPNTQISTPAPQPQGYRDPQLASVQSELQSVKQQLSDLITGQGNGVVEQFARGQTHYAEVEAELPGYIQIVKAQNPHWSPADILAEAYQRATWANPDVRAAMIAEQTAQAAEKQRTEQAAKVAQARNAAVSVRGAPVNGHAMPKPNGGTGDHYDDVRAAIRQLSGGV